MENNGARMSYTIGIVRYYYTNAWYSIGIVEFCHAALSLASWAPGWGHWCTLVRPDCVCALDHADCVLVASDKPGHMTYLTAALPLSNHVKLISCTYILLGAPIFWGGCQACPGLYFLKITTNICLN